MHEAYVSTQLLKLPGTLTIESFARYHLIESWWYVFSSSFISVLVTTSLLEPRKERY